MSQRKLAEKLGVVQGTISRWERGVLEPTEIDKKRMHAIFNLEFIPKNPEKARRTDEEIAHNRKARRILLNRLDRRYDGKLNQAAEDDPDFIQFKKLVGA